jgi:chemosensory pili system protein ChpA (sensor histidine kinase/response regulator)
MSDDKELEIRLQFLDEAQEYLATLETCLMGLTQTVDANRINEALRAAHSIKGGSALMGFQLLSDLAHRLEDNLKVLKVQRSKVEVDASLEQQLLAAVDGLAQVMQADRRQLTQGQQQQPPVDDQWLHHHLEPIFDQLHERLGDPEEEDAHSMLSPEDGQDIIPLLFQSEVEGCLNRLETVLADQSPRLREEVQILAQELGGLGEMLQLEPFTSLCHSIADLALRATDNSIATIAQAALETWRQTQTLVLAGQWGDLPETMDPPPSVELTEAPANHQTDDLPLWSSLPEEDPDIRTAMAVTAAETATSNGISAENPFQVEAEPDFETFIPTQDSFDWADSLPAQPSAPEESPEKDSTVRVPVKQINQLSDLFGELTIERNRLELEVSRLRDLVLTLQTRMRNLDQANGELRSVYDRVATQGTSKPMLMPGNGHGLDQGNMPFPENQIDRSHGQQFDALELDRYLDLHLPFREINETIIQLQEVGADIEISLEGTDQTTRNLRKTSRQLQKNLTTLRMRPLEDIFDRFPRALRQMSQQYNKPVKLEIQGNRTLVDRNVLEALQEPLMHIIRNCFDHGLEDPDIRRQRGKPETGTIAIAARQQNGRTWITIRDDGGGIGLDKIRDRACQMGLDEALLAAASTQELLSLIFEPGFSTASEVTDLSGRGVGMDVVRSRLKDIRGDIQVDTQPGEGTTFTLSIPYTLSVTRVLIVESHTLRIAFPVDAIEEMFVLPPEHIISTAGKDSFEWQGEIVQLVKLSRWLHFNCPISLESPEITPAISTPTVLLVQYNQRLVGIQVDRSWGEQEVALRRVAGNLPMPKGFNSCTIMGDGQVVPLVNIPELLYWIASCEADGNDTAENTIPAYLPAHYSIDPALKPPRKPTILLIDDSINVRRLLALTLEKAGYQVAQAKDGQDALDKLIAGLEVEAVVCDVEMPRLDGYGFLTKLKTESEHPHLPVAMLTSRSSQKHRQLALNLGAAAYFTKPYNEQHLLQVLEEMIQPALVT